MKHIALAAFAALALSITAARAESSNLAATETPLAAASVQSSCVTNDTGSEASPVFSTVTQVTQGGPVAHEGTAEATPVFSLRPAAVRPARIASANS